MLNSSLPLHAFPSHPFLLTWTSLHLFYLPFFSKDLGDLLATLSNLPYWHRLNLHLQCISLTGLPAPLNISFLSFKHFSYGIFSVYIPISTVAFWKSFGLAFLFCLFCKSIFCWSVSPQMLACWTTPLDSFISRSPQAQNIVNDSVL